MPKYLDSVIIGAGPAGCAAAIELSKKGLKVLLLERGPFDKDKPCGDAFLHPAICQLEELGLTSHDFSSLKGTAFDSISLFNNLNLIWEHRLHEKVGWLIPRKILDQKLREIVQKTATISFNSIVEAIEFQDNQIWKIRFRNGKTINHSYSQTIILATGASNKFSQEWNVSGIPLHSASISSYVSLKNFKTVSFQFTSEWKPGYGWVFPFSNEIVNIGVCAFSPSTTHLRKMGECYLLKLNGSHNVKWRGGSGPIWSGRGRQWHHINGLISCGDAAGLIDPINGEGITAALISGRNAGLSVYKYLSHGLDQKYLENYSKYIYEFFSEKYSDQLERMIWRKICFT